MSGEQSTKDSVALIAFGIALILTLAGILRAFASCTPSLGVRTLMTQVAGALKSLRRKDEDEMDAIITAKLVQQKVDHFRMVCSLGGIILSPLLVNIMYNIAAERDRVYTPAQDGIQFLVHTVMALILIVPNIVSPRTLDWIYGFFFLCGSLFVSPWLSNDATPVEALCVTILLTTLNMVRRSLPVVLPWNLLIVAAASGSIFRNTSGNWPALLFFLASAVVFVFVTPAVAQLLELGMRENMRHGFENRAAKEVLSAASALLRSFCEAMVELDGEGAITTPALDLASFLQHGPQHSLLGTRLSQLMPLEEDRDRFLAKLRPSGIDLAEAVNVRMLDSSGNTLELELFLFQFFHWDGERRHMVCIRSFSDGPSFGELPTPRRRQREPPPPPPHGGVGAARAELTAPPRVEPPAPARNAATSAPPSSATGGSDSSSSSSISEMEQIACVTVDSSRRGLPILASSPGFCQRVVDVPPGTLLVELVERGDDFARWIQSALGRTSSEGKDSRHCEVVLRTSQSWVMAMCCIVKRVPEPTEESQVYSGAEHLKLLFLHIRPCHGRAESPARPTSGAGLRSSQGGRVTL